MWYERCDNPHAIGTLYSARPNLNPVELHEVSLHRDGPLLRLRFDLPAFPDRPAARWPEAANTAQVVVDLWDVSEVVLGGWDTSNVGTLSIEREADGLRVSFEAAGPRIQCRCVAARIASVTTYVAEAA